jgi:CRP/FNR family transcriptional regulator
MAADAQRIALPQDRVMFDLHSRCHSMVMLTQGSIKVSKQTIKGRDILLYRVRPGETCILTVSCLLGSSTYPAQGMVETDLVGYAISQPMFVRLLEQSGPYREFVFHYFAERIADLMELIEEVTSRQLDQRLAALLLERGQTVSATHQGLADELGSVREVVSRILKDFESKGMVRLDRGQIQVLDHQALEHIATSLRDSGH